MASVKIFDYTMLLCAFYGLCIGVFAGALYDVLRIRRIAASKGRYGQKRKPAPLDGYFAPPPKEKFWSFDATLIFFGDFAFLATLGVAISILIFYENDGVLRWYALAACAVGFFAYRMTVGKLVMKTSDAILAKLKQFWHFAIAHTLDPVRRLLTKGKKAVLCRVAVKRTNRIFSSLATDLLPPQAGEVKKKETKKGGTLCNKIKAIHLPKQQKNRHSPSASS